MLTVLGELSGDLQAEGVSFARVDIEQSKELKARSVISYNYNCSVMCLKLLFEMMAIVNPQSKFNTHTHSPLSCSKLVSLRGGYCCLEVVSTSHHHRPVWAHHCMLTISCMSMYS